MKQILGRKLFNTEEPHIMAKRKADVLSQEPLAAGIKKPKHDKVEGNAQPFSLMDDSDSGNSSEDESNGGVKLKINEEYAKRFEHNKKREELSRCQLPCLLSFSWILTTSSGGEIQQGCQACKRTIW